MTVPNNEAEYAFALFPIGHQKPVAPEEESIYALRGFALLVIDESQLIKAAQARPLDAARDAVMEAMLAFSGGVGTGMSHGVDDRHPQDR